jgi:5,10-methylenetetrahydromethanopterin reductase
VGTAIAEFSVGLVGDSNLDELSRRALWLDASGRIAQLWIADERFYRDVWIQLALCASVTSRVRLGPSVTDPYIRHPALTAAAIATLDEMSRGRAMLGIGAGISGFDALGINRTRPAVAIREAIRLCRMLWSQRGAVNFEGELVRFKGDGLQFDSRASIPIVVAGRGPEILRLAGEVADGVIVATFTGGLPLDYALDRVAKGEAHRDHQLAPLRRISWVYFCAGSDSIAVRQAPKRGIAVALWGSLPILKSIGITLPVALGRHLETHSYSQEATSMDAVTALIPDELVDDFSVCGTPEECARKFYALSKRGFKEFAIWPFAEPGRSIDDTLDVLLNQVIPSYLKLSTADER